MRTANRHAEPITPLAITPSECVVRGTNRGRGRTSWLSPGNGAVVHLRYGRIILEAGASPLAFLNPEEETGLVCLGGNGIVRVGELNFAMGLYDSIYVPRNAAIEVRVDSNGCDLAEFSAPVDNDYPLRFVPFSEVLQDPGLHFKAGAESYAREVHILIGKNVQAGRLVAGVTFSQPGNWTSWPPHEHAAMLEEAYVYIAMPEPAWGMQFVYNDKDSPELAVVVREGDCVVMPQGYHPNVSAPGGSINFLWIMSAHREVVDRQFGVVNVQPEYAQGGSGLETGRE